MPRYIDVDLLKLGINKNDEIFCTPVRPLIIDLIDNMPTADVQEVKHGHWILRGDYAECSLCGEKSDTQYDGVELIPKMTRYCSNCGAKMDYKSK